MNRRELFGMLASVLLAKSKKDTTDEIQQLYFNHNDEGRLIDSSCVEWNSQMNPLLEKESVLSLQRIETLISDLKKSNEKKEFITIKIEIPY